MNLGVLMIVISVLGNFTGYLLHPKTQSLLTRSKILQNAIVLVTIYMALEDSSDRVRMTVQTFALFKLVSFLPPREFVLAVGALALYYM
jgi:hypothetical protein